MAAAWKAFVRMLGFGKSEEVTSDVSEQVRYHPYDEISDEQLTENRQRKPPRAHPYDEISDEQLAENRRPARSHPYDEISHEQLEENRREKSRIHPYDEVADSVLAENRKHKPAPKTRKTKEKSSNGATSDGSQLNYVDVEIQPGPKGGNATRPSGARASQSTVYTEVRPRAQ